MTTKIITKKSIVLFLAVSLLVTLNGCKSTSPAVTESTQSATGKTVTAIGMLHPQGTTTYQYGEYVLIDENGKTVYALKSDVVQLLKYAGKKVSIQGVLIADYPIEGGPPYMNVVTVEEIVIH